ncbi:Methylthioribulose-1-phosphate dehydratase [Savitreella phatthalungensis]
MKVTADLLSRHPHARLLCDLARQYFARGWLDGTGGGLSLQPAGDDVTAAIERVLDSSSEISVSRADGDESWVFLTPSGMFKEHLAPADLFVWDTATSDYIYRPTNVRTGLAAKPSASSDLFIHLHAKLGARAVIHTHSQHSNLATCNLDSGSRLDERTVGRWRCSDQEYLKGLANWHDGKMLANTDTAAVAVIANRPTEDQLLPDLAAACEKIASGEGASEDKLLACVLVHHHGAYHFARDWAKAKTQVECLEYLFELSYKQAILGPRQPWPDRSTATH